ncbi:MAG: glycosyltransferase family 2 protein [Pirellulales bacterium]
MFRPRRALSSAERLLLARRAGALSRRPKFSLVVAGQPSNPGWRKTIESVRSQVYSNWELLLGGSRQGCPAESLVWQALSEAQVRLLGTEGGPAEVFNRALASASGEWLILLDPGDELSADALLCLAEAATDRVTCIYSDESSLDARGWAADGIRKPGWSPELLLSQHYTGRLAAYRCAAVRAAGGWRATLGRAAEYDLVLRLAEGEGRIEHVPRVLYYRGYREVPQPAPAAEAVTAIADALGRRGIRGRVTPSPAAGTFSLVLEPVGEPLVSIIIPTRDHSGLLEQCVRSIVERTQYTRYEIVVVDNGSVEPETQRLFQRWSGNQRIRVLSAPGRFNYSRLNNLAVDRSTSDLVLLLNNDTEVINPEWLGVMVGFVQLPGVGAVGAKLYFQNDTIQHAGLILRGGGTGPKPAMSSHKFFRRQAAGYQGALHAVRNCSAVTAACLLVHREVYQAVGGFDEQLAVAYNDVDFCLKLRQRGLRIVWTPLAELYHYESASRGADRAGDPRWEQEKLRMHGKWGGMLCDDPYYNPSLSLDCTNFRLREAG